MFRPLTPGPTKVWQKCLNILYHTHVLSTWALQCARDHSKGLILKCRIKLAVETVVCLFCACWLANCRLSLESRRHVNNSLRIVQTVSVQDRRWQMWSSTTEEIGSVVYFARVPAFRSNGYWTRQWRRCTFVTQCFPLTKPLPVDTEREFGGELLGPDEAFLEERKWMFPCTPSRSTPGLH